MAKTNTNNGNSTKPVTAPPAADVKTAAPAAPAAAQKPAAPAAQTTTAAPATKPAAPAAQTTPAPANGVKADAKQITNEQIARRAYEIYQARGGDHGHHDDDWSQAERELRLGKQ